jgi:hypothetical protein
MDVITITVSVNNNRTVSVKSLARSHFSKEIGFRIGQMTRIYVYSLKTNLIYNLTGKQIKNSVIIYIVNADHMAAVYI